MYQYKDTIARVALHYLSNWSDAEDMVQEVLLKWIESAPVFQDEEHEKAWFIRVAINLSKNKVKSFWHRNITLSEDNIFPFHATRQESQLMEIIKSLPENYRLVIYLHYYEGYGLNEIAVLLNRNPNTVQTWHKRAKNELRKKLGVDFNERITESNGIVSKDI